MDGVGQDGSFGAFFKQKGCRHYRQGRFVLRWQGQRGHSLYLQVTMIQFDASIGPAGSQTFIVTVTGLWFVTVTNLGSRGFIPWPGVSI